MKLHEFCEMFPPMSYEDMERLIGDIKENGLREPIVMLGDSILDGRNRFTACRIAGVEPIFVKYVGDNPLSYVISKNMSRRHLNESQRAMLGARISDIKKTDAPLQQTQAAQVVNVSDRTVRKAHRVYRSEDPALIAGVENGTMSVSFAVKLSKLSPDLRKEVLADPKPETAIKRVVREHRERELSEKISELPDMQFGVIYADPPWRFATYSQNGMDRSADNHYPTLETDAICNLDVQSIAAENCALFLWATAPMLIDAIEVMATWGFTYKTHVVWIKDRIGTGYWLRNQHEILLIGTKGSIPAPAPGTQWPSIVDAPIGVHSAKPHVFYEMIEEYFPTTQKIELNARGVPREGWSAWGLEAEEVENV